MSKIIWEKFLKTVKKNNLILPNDRILCAVSAGPDSISLTHLLIRLKKILNFDLGLAYINHQLRPKKQIKKEIKLVKKIAEEFNLPYFIEEIRIKKTGLGLEAFARKLRYKALQKIAEKNHFNKIATGHTLNDQAESVLLNLIRSRNLDGITGIPLFRPTENKKIKIIRPLLEIKKEELIKYLKENKIKYCFDISNLDTSISRNLIRRKILPLMEKINPSVQEHLSEFAKFSYYKHQYIEKNIKRIFKRTAHTVKEKKDTISLDLLKFLRYNIYLQRKILTFCFEYLLKKNIEEKTVDQTLNFINSNRKEITIKEFLIKKCQTRIYLKKI
ncbi:MAG: tRNA lysidine(34) synthetase TilS [Endomicrobiia bacterium]